MISHYELTRKLCHERTQWKHGKHGRGDFVTGFMAGIDYALWAIRELWAIRLIRSKKSV